LLTGERVLAQHDVVIISHHALTDGRQGQLQMTPYRFVLTIEVSYFHSPRLRFFDCAT
jgi:hypothetical protein